MSLTKQQTEEVARRRLGLAATREKFLEARRRGAREYAYGLAAQIAEADPTVTRIWGFGSVFEPRQPFRKDSDIDLAVEGGWHHQLVSHMTLDIPGIRPALLSGDMTEGVDELRRFRHVFRNLYKSRLQPERVAFVQHYAESVVNTFGECHRRFVGWLDQLIDAEEG